ncbi:helix-turn-helix domain-containing protein [Succiniclasticum ruminis]|uniref:HTH cro/C1-type domain-containing protein n=1 Tax=Succiniclasticum ruminis DSM 9236 TaxID=1123323 RepID=A0A1I2D582_9FIRM|nr:helix-turn-helix transcriptional regulator [Succiniclasticum ruminis]SFE75672.1 hypothetical protein SAMN05216245_11710 [Succiniclasticum ruminis DSM 9236]
MKRLSDFVKEIIPVRLAAVRNAYGIPLKEVSWLCEDTSISALTAWESGSRTPAVDGLFDFAVSFGVSPNWLYGASKSPYDPEFLLYAESTKGVYESFLSRFIDTHMFIYRAREDELIARAHAYDSVDTRVSTFSLEARANLLVLIPYWYKLGKETLANPDIKKQLRYKMAERLNKCERSISMILLTGEASCIIATEECMDSQAQINV